MRRVRAFATLGLGAILTAVACTPTSTAPTGGTPSTIPGGPAVSGTVASPSVASPSFARPSPSATGTLADVAFERVVEDIVAPVGLVAAPEGGDRTFVVDQTGLVYVIRDGVRAEQPFLDIRDRLVRLDTEYDERGLLGLAFHPDYLANGRIYVYYSAPRGAADDPATVNHRNLLSEFRTAGADADLVDPATERVILSFRQPQANHSGGALGFGPDGFLYLGTGDGGGRGDADAGHSPQGNAQDTDKLNGKILRIDVDVAGAGAQDAPTYTIPDGNPFADGGGRPEIYAYGFRNPWRLSWEPDGDRRLLVSDVGYGRYEEVDAVLGGGNYGWRIREGAHCLDILEPLSEPTDCPTTGADDEPLIDPVIEYSHRAVGIAVVGGYVYRGTALPDLRGRYVFGDYSADWTTNDPQPNGSLLVATPGETDARWPWERLVVADDPLAYSFLTGMGEDADGELYVMTRRVSGPTSVTGEVFRIVPAP